MDDSSVASVDDAEEEALWRLWRGVRLRLEAAVAPHNMLARAGLRFRRGDHDFESRRA
jgi:hypothetical protein